MFHHPILVSVTLNELHDQFLGFVAVSAITLNEWTKNGGLGGGLGKGGVQNGNSVTLNA